MKPWVFVNAQGRIVARAPGDSAGPRYIPNNLTEAIENGLIQVQYRPRKKKVYSEFPSGKPRSAGFEK